MLHFHSLWGIKGFWRMRKEGGGGKRRTMSTIIVHRLLCGLTWLAIQDAKLEGFTLEFHLKG